MAAIVPVVRGKRDARAIAAHVRAVRAFAPDVLHANLRTPWAAAYGVAAGLLVRGVRTIAVEQLPIPSEDPLQRRLKRMASRRLAAHVAVGEQAARTVESYVGLPTGSVSTIYNGVPEARPTEPKRVSSGPTVGSLARLVPQKGLDLLIPALTACPNVTAVVVGDGEEREPLERAAREAGIAGRFVITGWTTEPRAYLAGFDVFVLPSRYEGFPLSIVEAMLAGLPVVAADVGSVSEAVIDGETGLLVAPDDPGALADAIRSLLSDPEQRRRMGENGRELARARFTAQAMADRFEELYSEVLGWR